MRERREKDVELSKSAYCCVKQHNGRLINYDAWYIKQSVFMVLWNILFPHLGDPIYRVLIGHWFQCG